jgi:integrase
MKLIKIPGKGNEHLYTRPDSDIIWVDKSKKGFKRIQQSLFVSNNIEARQKRDELFADLLGEKPRENKKVKKLAGERWDEWVSTKQRKRGQTIESIKYAGNHLRPMISGLYPDEINEKWWENTYIPFKRENVSTTRKFFNEWKWLSSCLHYMHRNGYIERIPRLENPDPARADGLNLDDSEIDALYANASDDLKLQIDLGFKHFMRRSEVLLLPYSEINFRLGIIELPESRTKTKKPRTIPLNPETLAKLKARKAINASPFVFPNPIDTKRPIGRTGNATAWNGAISRANKDRVQINHGATFHDLRHSGLSRAFVATNRYAEICIMAGLSLQEAQRTYLHVKPDQMRFVASLVTTKNTEMKTYDNL